MSIGRDTPNGLSKIEYSDLVECLSDPDSDLSHYLQYMIEVRVPGQLAPELEPNPRLVTGIPPRPEGGVLIGLANGVMRRRRHRAYRNRIRDGWTGPKLVSEGDSWFQYPTSLQDIIDHLMMDHAILSLGAAGDELSDIMVQREILLNIQAEGAAALLLSAGGNDLFDSGQLGLLVEEPFPGATANDLVGATFQAFLASLSARYLELLRRVHSAFPEVHILVHGYGPAYPRGGAWIERPLTKRGVPKSLQHQVVLLILRRFNDVLASFANASEFEGKVVHIDVTDVGSSPEDWYDEIHLNGENFAKVAARFRAELKKRLDGPRVEGGVSAVHAPTTQIAVLQQAEQLVKLEGPLLLRELDLRVELLALDPTVAEEVDLPPLVIGRPAPEIGLASIRFETRRLVDECMAALETIVCLDDQPVGPLQTVIVQAVKASNECLARAIAGWLVSSPMAVPAVLVSPLAALLSHEAKEAGLEALCKRRRAMVRTNAPAVARGLAGPSPKMTFGELRSRFCMPGDKNEFSAQYAKEVLERLDEDLACKVVEPPSVPVDADGAKKFRLRAETILELLGGEHQDREVDESEFGFAEALVLTDGTRPALYVQDGFIDLSDERLKRSGWLDRIVAKEDSIRKLVAATGRIIRGSDRSANSVYGTAWILPGGRVATAKHVLEAMTIQVGDEFYLDGNYFVDFAVEAGREIDHDSVFKIDAIDWASPDLIAQAVDPAHLDAATFKLTKRDDVPFPDPIPLATAEDAEKILGEEWFFNVGHPARPRGSWLVDEEDDDPKTVSRALVLALIGDRFGVKRFSPGLVDVQPGFFPGDQVNAHVLTHDATTLGGSSGSGLMADGKNGPVIMGLHFAGLFGTRNYAHWIPAIGRHFKG
jgi:hypothetical protein